MTAVEAYRIIQQMGIPEGMQISVNTIDDPIGIKVVLRWEVLHQIRHVRVYGGCFIITKEEMEVEFYKGLTLQRYYRDLLLSVVSECHSSIKTGKICQDVIPVTRSGRANSPDA